MGHGARRGGDAERGRRRRRGARRAHGGSPGDDVHRVAGPAADDPQHVQDRGRVDPAGDPRRRPGHRHPGPLDLRRPQRRDGRAGHRLRPCWRPALRRRRWTWRWWPTPPRWRAAHSLPALLRRLPHLARDRPGRTRSRSRTSARCCREAARLAHHRRALSPRPPDDPRHGAESRRLLPGPRGLQSLLPRLSHIVQDAMDRLAARTGRRVSPVRLRRRARRRAGDRHDGLRRRSRPGDRRGARRTTGEKVGVLKVRLFRPFPAEAFCAALPRDGPAPSPCWTAPRSRGARASRSTRTSSPPVPSRRTPAAGPFGDVGGRYGLASKEFTPAMVEGGVRRARDGPRRGITSPSASTTT